MSIPYLHEPSPTLLCAGLPTSPDDFVRISEEFGCTTAINLRATSEDPGRSLEEEITAAHLKYIHIPISSADDFTKENARKLQDSLDPNGKTFVFCGSSNRVGALLALKSFLFDGMSMVEALQFGEKAGMTHIKPKIEQILRTMKR